VPFINYVSSLATPLFLSLRLSANYESVNSLTSTGAEGSSKIVGKTPKIKETCIFGSEETIHAQFEILLRFLCAHENKNSSSNIGLIKYIHISIFFSG
jgi:hypothetical protein